MTPVYTLSAPVEVVTGGHNGFPGAVRLASGRIVVAWRAGTNHVGGTAGVIKESHSDDDGVTWSSPVTVLSESGIDLRDPALSLLSDGRIAMSLFRYTGSPLGVNVSYSSNAGATWTTPSVLPFEFAGWAACSGPIIESTPGTLMAFAYGIDAGASSIRCLTSADNGATWGSDTLLLDGPAAGLNFQEPFAGVLADGRVMVDVREGTGTWRRRLIRSLGGVWAAPVLLANGVRGRPAWMQTTQGHVILADRNNGTGRSIITAQENEAATLVAWQNHAPDTENEGAYQQMVELDGGVVGVAFCYEESDTDARLCWTTFSPDSYTPVTNRRRGAVVGLI